MADGFSMPAEWVPHERCWMAWPSRAETWGEHLDGARDVVAEIANEIARFEPVAIVTKETVAPLYLPAVRASLASRQAIEIVLPDGEANKNLDVLNRIFDALLQARCDRRTTVIALGGGVVGDNGCRRIG